MLAVLVEQSRLSADCAVLVEQNSLNVNCAGCLGRTE